jgi:hypothetical protein
MPKVRNDDLDALRTASWDMRASMEANARTLTALQRCIDDYRRTADPDALDEIGKHIRGIRRTAGHIREVLAVAAASVNAIKKTHG